MRLSILKNYSEHIGEHSFPIYFRFFNVILGHHNMELRICPRWSFMQDWPSSEKIFKRKSIRWKIHKLIILTRIYPGSFYQMHMVVNSNIFLGIKIKIIFSDFYTKWLKGIDSDWLIRNAEGGSRLNAGTRSSVMNMSRRSSRLAMVWSFDSYFSAFIINLFKNLPNTFKPPSSTSSGLGRPERRGLRHNHLFYIFTPLPNVYHTNLQFVYRISGSN